MMQTNVEGVYAGGDVVTFPLLQRGNKKVNIPHWQMAHVHGERYASHTSKPHQLHTPAPPPSRRGQTHGLLT